MLATLAACAALSLAPAQPGTLTFEKVRPFHMLHGPVRKDNKALPGEIYFVAFNIIGLKPRADGSIRYSMGMEILNSKGERQFRGEPGEIEVENALGSTSHPATGRATIGTDQPPGEYTMKVTVRDLIGKTENTLTHKFEILKPEFGFVRVGLLYDSGEPAPPLAVVGQHLYLTFRPSHFTVDDKDKTADVDVQVRILDGTGKPTLPKPATIKISKVPPGFAGVYTLAVGLDLDRPGNFTIEIKATDNKTKKTIEQSLNLTVVEVK